MAWPPTHHVSLGRASIAHTAHRTDAYNGRTYMTRTAIYTTGAVRAMRTTRTHIAAARAATELAAAARTASHAPPCDLDGRIDAQGARRLRRAPRRRCRAAQRPRNRPSRACLRPTSDLFLRGKLAGFLSHECPIAQQGEAGSHANAVAQAARADERARLLACARETGRLREETGALNCEDRRFSRQQL